MRCFSNVKHTVFLGLLAAMFVGTPAFGEISLPSAVELEKSMYFQSTSGEPVRFNPGFYEIEQHGENALNVVPVGSGLDEPTPIQAIPAGHDQDVDTSTARLVPSPDNNADKQHLVYVTPEGLALESVGSFSGVFSRAALTWSEKASGEEDSAEEPLTVAFDKATYFKATGGEPMVVQPGEYEVALSGDAVYLTPMGGKEETIAVEPESLGTSAAVVLPNINDDSNLELLMIGTVGGQSLVAVGSHDGTFPRGWGWVKKKARGVAKKAKGAAKKAVGKAKRITKKKVGAAYRFAKGKAKKYKGKIVRAAKKHSKRLATKVKRHGVDYVKKHGRKYAKKARAWEEKQYTKFCGGSEEKKRQCIDKAIAVAKTIRGQKG